MICGTLESIVMVVSAMAVLGIILYLAIKYWAFGLSLVAGLVLLTVGLASAEPVVPGNIDLDSRTIMVWEDGSFSTEISFSVEIDGFEVLLPSVIDGKLVSEEEAISHFFETGEHLGMFSSVEEAEEYALMLHQRQEEHYQKKEV